MSAKSLVTLSVLGLAAGCGGPGQGAGDAGSGGGCAFPSQPFVSQATDGGRYELALRSCPDQPPARGQETVEYTITNPGGAPQDGLTVSVLPFMPAMGHGTSAQTTVTPTGGGKYVVGNVYFAMPGEWQLITDIWAPGVPDAGPPTDSATITVEIN